VRCITGQRFSRSKTARLDACPYNADWLAKQQEIGDWRWIHVAYDRQRCRKVKSVEQFEYGGIVLTEVRDPWLGHRPVDTLRCQPELD
jgi:hypothetical protein